MDLSCWVVAVDEYGGAVRVLLKPCAVEARAGICKRLAGDGVGAAGQLCPARQHARTSCDPHKHERREEERRKQRSDGTRS